MPILPQAPGEGVQPAEVGADGYDGPDDMARSLEVGYQAIRERVAAGGPGWEFAGLPRNHYAAIVADPPWHFQSWMNGRWKGDGKIFTPAKAPEYNTMSVEQIAALPVAGLAATDCVLFLWGIWVMLPEALQVIEAWGFKYKTCAFCWSKADLTQMDMFKDSEEGQLGLGYWVRQNTEFCLLATRGQPKRLAADVRQAIIERRRAHSRKPDEAQERIERLVAGPYLELFARQRRPGWDAWGDEL